MGSGFSKKKKQAKQLQEQFMQMQEDLKNKEVVGSAGAGLVSLTLNGECDLLKVSIKPECIDPEDPEGLEDLIVAAYKDAKDKISQQTPMGDIQSLMGGLGGGLL